MSICHHFASVVRLSVNILHFDLLENHWTEFNLYLNPMETSYPGERFRLLGGSSLLWYQSTWNWLSPTQCNVIHRWLEFYKSCLQVQFDFLPFCIEKSVFFQNVLYAWMNVRTRCYIYVDIWPSVLAAVNGFKYVLLVELL